MSRFEFNSSSKPKQIKTLNILYSNVSKVGNYCYLTGENCHCFKITGTTIETPNKSVSIDITANSKDVYSKIVKGVKESQKSKDNLLGI